MRNELARRRALLTTALGFTRVQWLGPAPPVAVALGRWLDSWRGLGAVIVGMHAQGYDIGLQQYPDAWRANFSFTGIAHSVVHGSAWEPTPWRAVQAAAWEALTKPQTGAADVAVTDESPP